MRLAYGVVGLALASASAALGAEAALGWKQTDHSLALLRGESVVWQFNHEKEAGKPYFHPVTLGGTTLTALRPADHPWHLAIWFSWKKINGLVYWEVDRKTGKAQGETELTGVKAEPRGDHAARVAMDLSYHPPGKPAVMTEKRVVEMSLPAADGAYMMDWLSTFTAAGADVLLDRTPILGEPKGVGHGGYAGFSLRLAPELRNWQFADSQGPVKDRWKQAPWMSFSGPLGAGRSATIVVLDHPKSFRHPTPWYLIAGMPYFSPAVLYQQPYTLPARQSIVLRYRVLFQPGPLDAKAVEAQWRRFAEEP